MEHNTKAFYSFLQKMAARYKELFVALCFAAVYSFFFLLASPLHPWKNQLANTDSTVFKTVALMMQKGYMPYRDSFDHKGPLIFILNWIGNQISYYRGVWVVEYGFMICTVYFVYKIARLKVKPLSAAVTTLLSISLLTGYFEGGNLTEEYAMPFIAIGIYIFLDFLINDKISLMRLSVSGFCFGAVLLLRPNMIAVWIVFCISIFVGTVAKKEWRQLGKFIVWFSIGDAIIIMPVVLWLAANDALMQCCKDYIVFNFRYTSAESGGALFERKWESFFTYFATTVYILALVGVLSRLKKQTSLNMTYFIYMIVCPMLLCMSGRVYGHYGMVLVPAVAYPISLLFQNIESLDNREIVRAVEAILIVYALNTVIIPAGISWIKEVPASYEARNDSDLWTVYPELMDLIEKYTDENDAISVYGNMDFVYVLSQRRHATRYSYQFPVGIIMPEIMDEYMRELAEELPPLIVIQNGKMDDAIYSFLMENDYSFVWGENGEAKNGGIFAYYRK